VRNELTGCWMVGCDDISVIVDGLYMRDGLYKCLEGGEEKIYRFFARCYYDGGFGERFF
jgi:hypothetical protein